MSDVVDAQRQVGKSAVIVRVAGALLVLLGLANVVLAGIAAWTDDRRSVWSVWQPRVGARERFVRPGTRASSAP